MNKLDAKTFLTIDRSTLRKHCVRKMFDTIPEFANSISSKLLRDAMIFCEGYAEGVREEIMPPFNKKDLQQLILDQGFQYIKQQLIN